MGKIEPEVSGFKCFLFSGAEVAKSIKRDLDEMEKFYGRDIAPESD